MGDGVCRYARDKVGLELVQIDIQRAVETERGRDGRDNLRDQAIKIREGWLGDIESVLANVVNRFVVNLCSPLSVSGTNTYQTWSNTLTMNEQSECSSVVCVVRTEL